MKDQNQEELTNIELPKWPQAYTTGKSVSEDQALEIIRRTDSFFMCSSGNDPEFAEKIRASIGFPTAVPTGDMGEFRRRLEREDVWREKWDFLRLEYMSNGWITCSYINGPHGWMHPDGSIGFADIIGKWPKVEEFLSDWKQIAKTWSFLDIGATLMEKELYEEDTLPVVSIRVKDGEAHLVDPAKEDVHKDHSKFQRKAEMSDERFVAYLLTAVHVRECGLTPKQLQYFEQVAKEKGLV